MRLSDREPQKLTKTVLSGGMVSGGMVSCGMVSCGVVSCGVVGCGHFFLFHHYPQFFLVKNLV